MKPVSNDNTPDERDILKDDVQNDEFWEEDILSDDFSDDDLNDDLDDSLENSVGQDWDDNSRSDNRLTSKAPADSKPSSGSVDTSVYNSSGRTLRPAEKQNRSRKKNISSEGLFKLLSLILLVIACISIFFSVFLITRYKMKIEIIDGKPTFLTEKQFSALKKSAEDSVTEDVRELIKKRLSAGDSATYLLRIYYPEYIVFMNDGIYKFTKIDSTLRMNQLKKENFKVSENGELTYSENGQVISHKGIDLSKYQGNVNFSAVKNAGVEYAMLRCGYRGYDNGAIVTDPNFKTYAANAAANDIKIGAYFFSQAITTAEAVEEANFVLETVKPYHISYPIAIDIEDVAGKNPRQKELSKTELTDIVIAFCDTVKAAGYTPIIYANLAYFGDNLDYARLEAYDKWFASYTTTLYFPYEIAMWQYTNSGRIDGISGDVDINIGFKTWE